MTVKTRTQEWTQDDMVANIMAVYASASSLDFDNGKAWYASANAIVAKLADLTGFDIVTTAAVVAITSVRAKWVWNWTDNGNLRNARIVLESVTAGLTATDVRIPVFNSAKELAFEVARQADDSFTADVMDGRTKQRNFMLNILLDDSAVTVDGHATNIALLGPERASIKTALPLTGTRYDEIATAYRTAAKQAGLSPYVMQAVTWEAYRKL